MADQPTSAGDVELHVNGRAVEVPATGSLLDALRESLHLTGTKDGCSPQGQCGCCTVWIDGQPRVACVTPVTRVAGRSVTTIEGLPDAEAWAATFVEHGASQCGFCTPGIIMRVAASPDVKRSTRSGACQALLAHQCRCTGWQTIVDATVAGPTRDLDGAAAVDVGASAERARLEGGVDQAVGPSVALGAGGFADDTAPPDALVALLDTGGDWVVAESLAEARRLSGKVQGRRTTAPVVWPVELPDGAWVRTLRTAWVEPGYLEPDASWCLPGGEPTSSHGNGGAFGGKESGELGRVARRLADQYGRAVRVLYTREDVVRRGPKRPPVAAGVRADGSGVFRVARTPGIVDAVRSVAPGLDVVEVDVVGPPTSAALRGAGWAEALVLLTALQPGPAFEVRTPDGAQARASIDDDGSISVEVACGRPLDATVLTSYCIGAAHMALGWVTSEGLSVDDGGVPHDLTMRSFGIVRAADTPHIDVVVVDDERPSVNGSDAVFVAVATAVWHRADWATHWPTRRPTYVGRRVVDMTKPLGPYTPVVRAGDFIFVSGQVGVADGQLVAGGVAGQTAQAVANLAGQLDTVGASLTDVVKTTCFLVDMDSFATFNDAYVEALGAHRPARSTVAVRELPIGAKVEIEAVAYLPA